MADALSLRLSYFAILPASTSLLSSPSLSLVTSNDFFLTLQRLDVALAFVCAHPHYRDAPLYKMRFEHCLVRAGTLIRMYVINRFHQLVDETTVKLKEFDKSRTRKGKEKHFDADAHDLMALAEPPVSALLWDRFEEEGPEIRRLIEELEKRASSHAPQASTDLDSMAMMHRSTNQVDEESLLADYSQANTNGGEDEHDIFRAPEFVSLLEECRSAYLESRRSLLQGFITNISTHVEAVSLNESTSGTHENATARLVTKAMAFLLALAKAEVSLYTGFFSQNSHDNSFHPSLSGYLRSLSTTFDDRIRSRLTKEQTSSALSSICVAYVDGLDFDGTIVQQVAPFILSSSLSEAQNRLTALTRDTIGGKAISHYSPSEEDLDYPAKLKKSHRRAPSIGGAGLLEAAAEAHEKQTGFKQFDAPASSSSVRLFASPPKHVVSTWYPPLATTLRLLSQCSSALISGTFVDLASSALDACRSNLFAAAQEMSSQGGLGAGRIGLTSRMDVPLFHLRHLLLLREMAASVDLRHTSRSTFAIDRRVAGHEAGVSASRALDFARLVETLNSLWTGFTGMTQIPTQPSSKADSQAAAKAADSRSKIELDLSEVQKQFVNIVAQGVVLPLRVFLDQRARAAASQTRSPPVGSDKVQSPPMPTSPPARSRSSIGGSLYSTKARSAYQAFETCAKSNLKEAREALSLYIEDSRAIQSLSDPIMVSSSQKYGNLLIMSVAVTNPSQLR